jgi:iron uptake system EfeUOB component EfeO/EfeM
MLSATSTRAALVAMLALGALAGCGGSAKHASNPPAQPYSQRSTAPGSVARVTPKDYRAPIATYKRYVRRQLGTLVRDVAGLRAAIARGDLASARAAWLKGDARYESIGAAYGAFGDLDAAVRDNLRRTEVALWRVRSPRAAARPAARLATAVARLRARVATMTIDPLEYSLRAHEILEDGIHLQLSGQASPWSGAALVALRAEVRGTRVVLQTLDPLLARRDPTAAVPLARRALRRLSAALARLERGDGSLPRWDRVGQRDRELVDGLAAGAAEQLAYVPELIDPRPPRPAQRAFGSGS